jgi:hypothetical protein
MFLPHMTMVPYTQGMTGLYLVLETFLVYDSYSVVEYETLKTLF